MKFVRDRAHVLRVIGRLQMLNMEELSFKARVKRTAYLKKLNKELDNMLDIRDCL